MDQNHGLTPLEKYQLFDLLNLNRLRLRLDSGDLTRKVGKMAIFGPKPWVNPFGKMSIFRLFGLHVFINTSRIPLRPAMDSFQERKHKNFQVESDPFFGHL